MRASLLAVIFFSSVICAPAIIDRDLDGLSDVWEHAFLGGAGRNQDDLDGDGLTNQAEMIWGTNPLVRDSEWTEVSIRLESASSAELFWHGIEGRFYRVAESEDLQNWTTLPGTVESPYAVSLSGAKRFWRIEVTLNSNDSDGDGLEDWEDAAYRTAFAIHPSVADSDGDGTRDAAEFVGGSFFTGRDADADGLDDRWEVKNGFDVAKQDNPIVRLIVYTPLE